jgi:hypothetical protein
MILSAKAGGKFAGKAGELPILANAGLDVMTKAVVQKKPKKEYKCDGISNSKFKVQNLTAVFR